MKKIIKFATLALCIGIVGCQDKLDVTDGVAGIGSNNPSGAAAYMNTPLGTININKAIEGGATEVEVRLASVPNSDVKITVTTEDFFDAYNKENKTKYRILPTNMYELYESGNPNNVSTNGVITVTVKQGSIAAKVGVRVKPLDDEKFPVAVKYAVPLRIAASSATKILSNNKSVITFNRPFKTSVAEIKQGNNFSVALDPEIPNVDEFTIQGHFMFSNWKRITHDWNQSLINFRGGAGSNWWYTRVGKNSLQVKDLDADGDATHINQEVKLNTWYQISFVYKENNLRVYVNGKLAKTFVRPNLRFVKGEGGAIAVGNSGNADSRDYRIREVRVWNRALTEAEINADLYLPVDPNSEGLLVYLPLNKKTGFKNQTKYNNKVSFGKEGHNPKTDNPLKEEDITVEWTENVKFPAEGLVIEK